MSFSTYSIVKRLTATVSMMKKTRRVTGSSTDVSRMNVSVEMAITHVRKDMSRVSFSRKCQTRARREKVAGGAARAKRIEPPLSTGAPRTGLAAILAAMVTGERLATERRR
mgnify:CR=1 FL=1